jgi:uncharacterized protein YlxW (UPF0749 family)
MPEPEARPRGTRNEPEAHAAGATGRDRLLATLRTPTWSQLVVGSLLAAVGFAAVVQVNNTQLDNTYAGLREQDLIEILTGLTGTAERARREVDRLEQTRNELQSESTRRDAALTQTQERVKTLNIIAGLVPVRGPGIRIRIEEKDGRASLNALLDLVQELRTADAEAMEFNNKYRLGASSAFDTTEGGIELDGNLVEPPYLVDVIGDPHALRGALTFDSGPIDQFQDDGATVEVEELESLDIESVRTPVQPENAQVDTSQ